MIVRLFGLLSDKCFLSAVPVIFPTLVQVDGNFSIFHLDSAVNMELDGLGVGSMFVNQDSMSQRLRRVAYLDWNSALQYDWPAVDAIVNIVNGTTRFLLACTEHCSVNAIPKHSSSAESSQIFRGMYVHYAQSVGINDART